MTYLRRKLRKFGWRRFVRVACLLAFERLYRKDHYFVFRRNAEPFRLPKTTPVRAMRITKEHTLEFANRFPYRPHIFLGRLASGLVGLFYLSNDGFPAGYHWYVVGRDFYEPEYHWTFRLGPGDAYLFDAYLVPACRGSMITAQGFVHTLAVMREVGARTLCSVSDKRNVSSWRLHLHLGFEIDGCIEVTRVLGRAIHARSVDLQRHITPQIEASIERHSHPRGRTQGQGALVAQAGRAR